MSPVDRSEVDFDDLDSLRGYVAALEQQLVEVEDWANRAVGAAQERAYWLDRWQVDLNAVMRRPAAGRVRGGLRGLRAVYRWSIRLRRRLGA